MLVTLWKCQQISSRLWNTLKTCNPSGIDNHVPYFQSHANPLTSPFWRLLWTSAGRLHHVCVGLGVVLAINAPPHSTPLFEIRALSIVYGIKAFVFSQWCGFLLLKCLQQSSPTHPHNSDRGKCVWFSPPLSSHHLVSLCLTRKSHFWMWDHAFEVAAHQSYTLKMYLMVFCHAVLWREVRNHMATVCSLQHCRCVMHCPTAAYLVPANMSKAFFFFSFFLFFWLGMLRLCWDSIICFRWMPGKWTHHTDMLIMAALELPSWCSV